MHSAPESEDPGHDHDSEVYLGEQSIPSFVQEQIEDGYRSAGPRATDFGREVLPMLGLQSPRDSFPDWQTGGHQAQGVHDLLPGRDETLE